MKEGARFIGKDHQVDYYFHVDKGRLKLRQGTIENYLIYYNRPDREAPKVSAVRLFPVQSRTPLLPLLTEALGLKVVVDKIRRIYFIHNVKFHLDEVKGLGSFVEIEAIGSVEGPEIEELENQCKNYMQVLRIPPENLVANSYSDLLLNQST